MASDILSFASEVGKTFTELQELIIKMKESGINFTFDEVKSYTHLEGSDIEKIKEKLNVISAKNTKKSDDTKTISKGGKKFKVRKRRKPKVEVKEEPKAEVKEEEGSVTQPTKVADVASGDTGNISETSKTETQHRPEKTDDSQDKHVSKSDESKTGSVDTVNTEITVSQQKETVKAQDIESQQQRSENKKEKSEDKIKKEDDKLTGKKEVDKTSDVTVKSETHKSVAQADGENKKKEEKLNQNKRPSSNNAVIISRPSKKVTYNMKNEKPDKNYSSSRHHKSDKKDGGYKKSYGSDNRYKKKTIIPVAPDVTNAETNKFSRKKYENKSSSNDDYADRKKKKTEKRKNNQKTKVYSSAQLEAMEMDGYDASKKRRKGKKKVKKVFKTTEITVPKASKRVIKLTNENIVIADLAKEMNIKAATLIQNLFKLGVMATINQVIDIDTATLLANELGYEIQLEKFDAEKIIESKIETKDLKLERKERAPIVTVMGHVDHGKTKLLDAIRQTNVIDTEAGGITQHIGAYRVKTEGGYVTFLDTPGHEAFTSMRARGANVTDIVILIVAADDGIMPQTVEAINHAQAANVPIIVAINKIDKPGINISKIKEELTAYNLVSEDWGGDTIICEISAKQKIGIENLLENVLLQAEMLELTAVEDIPAKATVIEAFIDKGRGAVTNALIQEGHLQVGDFVVAGEIYGKIRALFDDKGNKIDYAGPAVPVSILGLNGVPLAGEPLLATNDEKTAKQIAAHYANKIREEELKRKSMLSAENLFQQLKESEMKELRIVVKADVQGSVEAVKAVLVRLSNEEVKVNVIHAAVGAILENDINLALASNALIVGFNVRPATRVKELADKNGIEIRLYSIIYNMEEDIERLTKGMLEPVIKEVFLGTAEVLTTFNIPKVGTIAGCMVRKGKILRNSNVRVIRDSVVIADDTLKSLKRFKDDAKEVKEGFECGLGLQKYNDIKVGDIIESYVLEEEKQG